MSTSNVVSTFFAVERPLDKKYSEKVVVPIDDKYNVCVQFGAL